MIIRKYYITMLACGISTLPGTLHAQAVPDIQDTITQGSQIDDIIQRQDRIGPRPGKDDNEIDGEAGIYVLRVNEIFYVGGSSGISYSGNPLRTVDDVGGDFSFNLAATAGMQTRIAEAFDFGISANIAGTEYTKSFAPSSRNINGAINIGTQIGQTPLYLGASAFGGFNYDQDFKNSTAFYGGSAALSVGLPLSRRTFVRPVLSVTRQWSETEENNSISVSGAFTITHAITNNFSIGASASVAHSWYDDFFEDVTFIKRKDWQYGGGVNAGYRISDNISVGVAAGYEKRDSTFFLSKYESFETSLSLSARIRF